MSRELLLRGHAWHDVKLKLNAHGRRRVARRKRIGLWLQYGFGSYARVVLVRR